MSVVLTGCTGVLDDEDGASRDDDEAHEFDDADEADEEASDEESDAGRADAGGRSRRDGSTRDAGAGRGADARADDGAAGLREGGTRPGDTGAPTGDAGAVGAPIPVDDVPAGAYCAEAATWDAQAAQFEEDVLSLTNEARAAGHNCDTEGNFGPAAPLTMEGRLRCAARLHSKYMAETNDFAHMQSATGDDPFERMEKAGYRLRAGGENIAAGQTTPRQVVDGWLESDGHCANIMNPIFTQLGVGYAVGQGAAPRRNAPYWTQNFGRPL